MKTYSFEVSIGYRAASGNGAIIRDMRLVLIGGAVPRNIAHIECGVDVKPETQFDLIGEAITDFLESQGHQ